MGASGLCLLGAAENNVGRCWVAGQSCRPCWRASRPRTARWRRAWPPACCRSPRSIVRPASACCRSWWRSGYRWVHDLTRLTQRTQLQACMPRARSHARPCHSPPSSCAPGELALGATSYILSIHMEYGGGDVAGWLAGWLVLAWHGRPGGCRTTTSATRARWSPPRSPACRVRGCAASCLCGCPDLATNSWLAGLCCSCSCSCSCAAARHHRTPRPHTHARTPDHRSHLRAGLVPEQPSASGGRRRRPATVGRQRRPRRRVIITLLLPRRP
jgi:hypothetical protein